ncbi:periplasmic protein [Legionella rubrilucens]|uniref:Periplasmic protein n=1 Tax=Legionella rubrilucens TaxID=458 RepID=A0A0W0XWC1_9GAMM|nr:translocation/assembly module TamB domain-containing protein [Legionella rubrilucens]KTD48754.1 periplasmic protein [Legionella rubrilucens]
MMRFLKKISKSIIYSLLLAFVLLTSILVFLATTTPGLYLTVKLAHAFLPGQLHIRQASGHLSGRLTIGQLTYEGKGLLIEGRGVQIRCSLRQLLFHHRLSFKNLQAKQVLIQPGPATQTASGAFGIPEFPLAIMAKQAHIDRLVIGNPDSDSVLQQIHLEAFLSNDRWQLRRFDFDYQGHQWHVTAKATPRFPYPLNARIELSPVKPRQGLKGSLAMTGNLTAYRWHGQFQGLSDLQLTGTLKNGQQLDTRLRWQSLHWPFPGLSQPLTSANGQLLIRGTLPELNMQVDTQFTAPLPSHLTVKAHTTGGERLDAKGVFTFPHHQLQFTAGYDKQRSPKIQGKLTAQSLAESANDLLIQHLKAEASFNGDTVNTLAATGWLRAQYNAEPLKLTANYQNQELKATLLLANNSLSLIGTPASHWQAKATLPNPALLHPALKDLTSTLSLTAELNKTDSGRLVVTMGEGHYQDPALQPLAFKGGELRAELTPHELKAKGQFKIDANKNAAFKLTLPQFQWAQLLTGQQILDSELTISINSLAFLNEINSALSEPAGQLQAHLQARGPLHRPIVKGKLTLSHGRVALPQWGIHLNPIDLTMETHDQQWVIEGALFSNNQPLHVKGKGQFAPHFTGSLHFNGDHVQVLNLDEYQMELSPKLTFDFKPSSYALSGELLVPKASIKPHTFDSSASLSSDVVFAGQKQPEPNPLHIDSNVRLDMGEDVAIDIKGLKGYLEGSLQLRQLPEGPMRATGELTVRDGKYHAYGQDLLIQQGQLIYTGSLIDNPDMKVRAIRQFNNASASFAGSNRLFDFNTENLQSYDFGSKTTVGIEVSGHLNRPKTQLFSIPSNLSQADILSMLLLGKPASQANKSGGQLLLAAISSMNLDSGSKGTQLLEQLKNNLGFDVNVENNTEYNRKTNETTDTTSFVVGKSLSNRLYLSYNMGFSQGSNNLLTLKYLLNKFFSIQVSASLSGSSGVDLLYTHQKDSE